MSQQVDGEYTSPDLDAGEEFLENFSTNQPTTVSFTPYNSPRDTDGDGNADGNTTSWDGSTLSTFYADGRGTLNLSANSNPFTTFFFSPPASG